MIDIPRDARDAPVFTCGEVTEDEVLLNLVIKATDVRA